MFFRYNYFDLKSFFMNSHFTKIFVHLLIISAVGNFNVFKLIGWDLAYNSLLKSIQTLEKSVKYVQS